MKLANLKFHAFTNTGFEPVLSKEIGQIIKKQKITNIFGKTGVEFRGTVFDMIDVILYSRVLNSLKVVVGHPFHASDQNILKYNLRKLNFSAYMNSYTYHPNNINLYCDSIKSSLFHECMIKELAKEEISNLLQKRLLTAGKETVNIDRLLDDFGMNNEFSKEEMESLKAESNKEEENDQETTEIVYRNPNPTDIYLNLFKNKMCVSLEVFNSNRMKSGYKKFIGWGSVKESIISAFLQQSGIIDEFKENHSIKIFDPFCGSGTILLESILSSISYPMRADNIGNMGFNDWPLITNKTENIDDISAHIESRLNNIDDQMKISIIGSDISKKQLDNAVSNFKHLESLDIIKKMRLNDNKTIIALKERLKEKKTFTKNFKNKVFLFKSSFDKLDEIVPLLEDYILLTNVPYGSNMSKEQTTQLYKQFDRFLIDNKDIFSKIVILCPNNESTSYIAQSKYIWECELDFYNGAYRMGFFSFTGEKKDKTKDTVIYKIKVKRRRQSNYVKEVKVDLKKIQKKESFSKKANDLNQFARKQKRNAFLASKKAYEDQKQERIQKRIEEKELMRIEHMKENAKKLLGKEKFEEFNKLLK